MKPEKIIGICILLFSVLWNLWIFRMEPTARTDPNDNTFQYALVDRTNQIWDYADHVCSGITKPFCALSYLTDHWVPNWAEGYNLPYYYSHLPQVAITASWRIISHFNAGYTLFTHYHWVIYLLLCLFPLSVFLAARIVGFSFVSAGLTSLIASHLSTDGLYGLDPSSFLWRGFGLSSQLFAMIWLPLAIAYAYTYFVRDAEKKNSFMSALPSVLFLALTTAGHLGIGIITFLSVGILAIAPSIQTITTNQWTSDTTRNLMTTVIKLMSVFGAVGLLLGYWIIPVLTDSSYHNISVWDGIWKFDSFGYREVLTNFINGNLFDFGRAPILTILVVVGIFASVSTRFFALAILFAFWMLMYFGRTTWGGFFNVIPGMSEFHLSRFIVGVHIAGIFMIAVCVDWIMNAITSRLPVPHRAMTIYACCAVLFITSIAVVFPQTVRYAEYNDLLIQRGNTNAAKDERDVQDLFAALKTVTASRPGRVFAGRGGSWGKNFRIAETPMYMHLSTYGIPVVLWLPETWSPNSDTEQYFSEAYPDHYTLYNVRFVVTPTDLAKDQIQPFWKLLEAGKTWKLYEVIPTKDTPSMGYISTGVRPAVVSSDKQDYRSVVRLWMHSDFPKAQVYPELTFDPNYPKTSGLPNFRMLDESTYMVPDRGIHNLFSEVPRYVSPSAALPTVVSQSVENDMTFKATVEVKATCTECLVILKQTYHPSWRVTIDGKPANAFAVFPFFTAVKLETPGTHDVVFSYRPSEVKQLLLLVSLFTIGYILWVVGETIRKQSR